MDWEVSEWRFGAYGDCLTGVLKIDRIDNNVLLIHLSLQVSKIMSAACSARA